MSFSLHVIGSTVPVDLDERVNAAIQFLTARGYHITMPKERGPKLLCKEVCNRIGLSAAGLCKRLKHPACPFYEHGESETGRILWLRLNPELEAYLRRAVTPGRSLHTPATEVV